MWEFTAVAQGFAKAHETEKPGKLSSAEADDIWEYMQAHTTH